MQQILSQLNLTDAQKQQIDQIRQTVTDRRERHEEIMKVLTPDQQAKFEQLRPRRYNGGGGGAPDSATTPTPAPAPSPPPAPPPGN
jgi:Spy/CpxP family protein refolding chaperone